MKDFKDCVSVLCICFVCARSISFFFFSILKISLAMFNKIKFQSLSPTKIKSVVLFNFFLKKNQENPRKYEEIFSSL